MVSLSVDAELDNSPATQMNGRPSTMSLVMPSRFSRWGMSVDVHLETGMNPIAHASSQQGRNVSFMVKTFQDNGVDDVGLPKTATTTTETPPILPQAAAGEGIFADDL
jgi:hypothetical protein